LVIVKEVLAQPAQVQRSVDGLATVIVPRLWVLAPLNVCGAADVVAVVDADAVVDAAPATVCVVVAVSVVV
jgi:hypothetical protein